MTPPVCPAHCVWPSPLVPVPEALALRAGRFGAAVRGGPGIGLLRSHSIKEIR